MNELVRRLSDLYGGLNSESGFEITFSDAIPLNELFNCIDEHFSIRVEIQNLRKLLEDRSF